MKQVFFYLFIFLSFCKINAQVNLVPNYSFETYTSCPTGSSQISLAVPWKGVTTNSTDYFNACGTGGASVPISGAAWQYARTGVAYAGIWAQQGYYREYLQVKLDSVLLQDSCYLVEFYCNVSNLSAYGIRKMAAGLSNTAISAVGPGQVLQYTPQIVSNQFLADTVNWMRVTGYYKAIGGEQYITIGNFDTSLSDTVHVGGNLFGHSYYLIDDVTVRKIQGCDTIPKLPVNNSNLTLPNIFTPNNDGTNDVFTIISKNIKTLNCKIYNRWGVLVGELIEAKEIWDGRTSAGLQCVEGVYYYVLTATGLDGKEYSEKGVVQLLR